MVSEPTPVALIQKKRIIEFIKQGKRFDGRKLDEYRDIKAEIGISQNAEGSCSVKIGKTEVYAGVKMSIIAPYADGPKDGTLSVSFELGPIADDDFDAGQPGIDSIEMARVIDRGIRESGVLAFDQLCVKEGEKVWQISVDLYAMNNDGNLFDAASLAALVALASAKMPVYNETTAKIEHELTDKSVPLIKENISFNMTIHKIGDSLILDPTKEEELISDYRVSLSVGSFEDKPRITAMQKGKGKSITEEEMEKILNLVEDKANETYKKFSKLVFNK